MSAVWNPSVPLVFRPVFHPEDDPMEKHDHPTASQRLGDTEAGLGAAATLTSADADAIRRIKGVQYVSEGIHTNAHVAWGSKRWFTRLHGDDVSLPQIRRAWTFEHGRFYSKREESNATQVIVLGAVASQRLFGDQNPVGKTVNLWKQPFEVVGVVGSGSWMVAPAPGDDQFDAVYVPFTTIQRLLNLSKLNDITITTASSGDVTRVAKAITDAAAHAAQNRIQESGRFHGHQSGSAGVGQGRNACRKWLDPWSEMWPASKRSRWSNWAKRSIAPAAP